MKLANITVLLLHTCVIAFTPTVQIPSFATDFKNGTKLQMQINNAIANGDSTFFIPAGDYAFMDNGPASHIRPGSSLLTAGASNFRLSGAGVNTTTLWFAPGYGIDTESCTNIIVEKFSVDLLTPPFAQGQLVSLDHTTKSVVVVIEDGFPLLTNPYLFNDTCPDGSAGTCSEIKCVFWHKPTRRMFQTQQLANPARNMSCNKRTCTAYLPALDPSWSPASADDTLVTFSPRLWASKWPVPSYYRGFISIYNCTQATFQDITIHSSGDMVLVETLGGGGNVYRRDRIVRRDAATAPYAPRLLAGNDDAFHSMSVEKGPLVEDCESSFIADDFVNVHNRLLPLASLVLVGATTAKALVLDVGVAPIHGFSGETRDDSLNAHIGHTMSLIDVGDELTVYAVDDEGVLVQGDVTKALGTLKVKSIPKLINKNTHTVPPLPDALVNRVEPDSQALYEVLVSVELSQPLPHNLSRFGALLQIDRFSSKNAVLRHNYFHDSYNNVGRLASDVSFIHNIVERANFGLHVSDDIANYNFLEGPVGSRRIDIVNNSFISIAGCPGGVTPCAELCETMTCLLSKVDEAYAPQVHVSGNVVEKS